MTARLVAAALAACALVGTSAAPAGASKSQESIFQDDKALLLFPAERDQVLSEIDSLGADTIHTLVRWDKLAPRPTSKRRPSFNAADPRAYPPAAWDALDGLVRGAKARGLDLLLSPTGPIPLWASECKRVSASRMRTCDPSPKEFRRFLTALGSRYSGTYRDENEGGATLPAVDRWAIWNEPNQGGWLTPQFAKVDGKLQPASPVRYRLLVAAAVTALRSTGHASDQIVMGETAPIGRRTGSATTRPMAPGVFWRALLCIDTRGRKLTGADAKALGCRRYRKPLVSAVSHHPYTKGGSQPPTVKGATDEITIASIKRLETILARGGARGRISRSLVRRILFTEFGIQTNPPDTTFGVSLTNQARYINQADYLTFANSRVRSVAQYELYDDELNSGFQTGLRFFDHREKPSLAAYRLPIYVVGDGASVRVWGQIRPAANGSTQRVEIQNATSPSAPFTAVTQVVVTNPRGYFSVPVDAHPGFWRLAWKPSESAAPLYSRTAVAASR